MKGKLNRFKKSRDPVELNIICVMDIVVTLILFLLTTTVFVNIFMIDTKLPVPAQIVSENKEDQKVDIRLNMLENGLVLILEETYPKNPSKNVVKKTGFENKEPGVYDFNNLHRALVDIKKKYPMEETILLRPWNHVKYKKVIDAMDACGELKKNDPVVVAKTITGKDIKLTALFPNIFMGSED